MDFLPSTKLIQRAEQYALAKRLAFASDPRDPREEFQPEAEVVALLCDFVLAESSPYPRPRVHGNGFIQIDISPEMRLHFWGHPDIPRQQRQSPIHDHSFSFFSFILKGALTDCRFDFVDDPDGFFDVCLAQTREAADTILVRTGQRMRRVYSRQQTYRAGSSYQIQAGEFHESTPEKPTISCIVKDGPSLAQGGPPPRVLVPVGQEPENEFNRYAYEPEFLWRIVREVLAS